MRTSTLFFLVYVLAAGMPFMASADLKLHSGTKIEFGDGTSQSSALQSGLSLPAGHGGTNNTVTGMSAFVGGGDSNLASGDYSTVAGGDTNMASGLASTVAGGNQCIAAGDYSFAGGYLAQATHLGSFVWADYDFDRPVNSNTNNQFKVRARGGFFFVTGYLLGGEYGAELPTGAAAWETRSSKEAKENYTAIDPVEVLDKLAAIPVERWNYRHQDESIQHIGPYAQDFYAAFGLNGEYRGTISTQDADGIAFAAIQGVNAKLKRELAQRDEELAAIRAELKSLEARLNVQPAEAQED